MADAVILTAQERSEHGTHNARRMRKAGKIPAVLYGHKEATVPLTLSRDELYKAVRHGVRLVDVKQGDKSEKALIRDVQWDPLGHDILHVDFARVSMDERIEVDVRVELRGTAPGVATAGGVLNQPLHTLKVECLAISIPESIRVSIAELQIDKAIYVKDLTVPEGVKILNDPDAIVVQCAPKIVEEVVAVPGAAPTAEQAEPELIGRQKAEEGEEEAEEKKK